MICLATRRVGGFLRSTQLVSVRYFVSKREERFQDVIGLLRDSASKKDANSQLMLGVTLFEEAFMIYGEESQKYSQQFQLEGQ